MIRLAILAKVYCSEQGCSAYFKVEIPATVLPLTADNEVKLRLHDTQVPQGWLFKMYREAFCPKHNPDISIETPDPKAPPTPEVLDRARKLQALATDKGATEGERRNAWEQFGKLWAKYELPNDIGLEQPEEEDTIEYVPT
jgi:hypothetical protein